MRVYLDRQGQTLTMTHVTEDNDQGTLVLPTDPFQTYALETVRSPLGHIIHEETFLATNLGGADSNVGAYVVAMTNSARRKFRRAS